MRKELEVTNNLEPIRYLFCKLIKFYINIVIYDTRKCTFLNLIPANRIHNKM